MKTKKISWGFIVLFSLLTVCGCTVNEEGVSMKTINIVAYRDAWYTTTVPMGTKGYYMYQEFSFPEIDNAVMNDGAVLVYYNDNYYRDNILPLILPYEDGQYDEITENVRYEYEKGILTIIIESSDFSAAARTSDMLFKVCILRD